ncbi:WhiB family transcriptional regulator [uncultured Williamsia sp.]|uniref:WhiB family transcriptional regulator n=1 Tax=uncultured Williamsia sp. TaxID=259311 RepID=UPI002606C6A3|nr:WhiB family transcriptional regulator [uncultured Williamsia sp.]
MFMPINEPADWEADAICGEVDPELWFPDRGEHSKAAARLCGQCPVQGECLDAALERDERFGIWGGLNTRQRDRLARRRRSA